MPVPFWAGHYVGLPFREHGRDRQGLDCWGLVRLVYQEQYGILLPGYDTAYKSTFSKTDVPDVIDRVSREWVAISPSREQEGDVIVLRLRGLPMHVGLVLGDRSMLHVERGIDAVIERYSSPRWENLIHGFFRHVSQY